MAVGFHAPSTVDEAVGLIAGDPGAMFLAGGQTLVAMMNAELIEPSAVISLDRISSLKGIERQADGSVRIGAMTTQAEIAASGDLTGGHAAVREAAAVIAHSAIRNLGTIGGAVSHGDPSSDLPAALVAADAAMEIAGPNGSRSVAAGEFFLDFLTTALGENELLTGVVLPAGSAAAIGHYLKFARTDGDYATVSVAVVLAMKNGKCESVRLALGACGPVPVHVPEANAGLVGTDLKESAVEQAAKLLVAACDPVDDVRGSAGYRLTLVPRLVSRAVETARARGSS